MRCHIPERPEGVMQSARSKRCAMLTGTGGTESRVQDETALMGRAARWHRAPGVIATSSRSESLCSRRNVAQDRELGD